MPAQPVVRRTGITLREMRLQLGGAVSIYIEEGSDTAIKSFLPIPKLPLIQNISQIFSSALYSALCSGMVLLKTLEFPQMFLDGRLNCLSRCAGVVNPTRGYISVELQKSFHS